MFTQKRLVAFLFAFQLAQVVSSSHAQAACDPADLRAGPHSQNQKWNQERELDPGAGLLPDALRHGVPHGDGGGQAEG